MGLSISETRAELREMVDSLRPHVWAGRWNSVDSTPDSQHRRVSCGILVFQRAAEDEVS